MEQINTLSTSNRVANLITSVEETTTTITPKIEKITCPLNRNCYVKSWHARVCIWTTHESKESTYALCTPDTLFEPIYFSSLTERVTQNNEPFQKNPIFELSTNCPSISFFGSDCIPFRFRIRPSVFFTSFGTTNTHFFLCLLHSSLSLFFNHIRTYRVSARARTNNSPHQWQRI